MSRELFLLADVQLEDLLPGAPAAHPVMHEALVICGAVLLASLPIVVWAAFFRKRPRRRHSHHCHVSRKAKDSPAGIAHSRPAPPGEPASAAPCENGHSSEAGFPRRRKRRRRRAHRSLNPTLAETGGLPPIRTDPPSGSPT